MGRGGLWCVLAIVLALVSHEAPDTVDPDWAEHAASLLRWVRTAFGRGPFAGAWGINEQWGPRQARLLLARRARQHDVTLGGRQRAPLCAYRYEATRELATRSLNYATYFTASDGRVSCCGQRPTNTFWFSDGYGDYLRSFNWAMAAIPELAPGGRDHLLGSTSVVQSVAYGRRRLSYRTFATKSSEVLRLSYLPRSIVAGHTLAARGDLDAEGYVVRKLGGGDYAIRIRHDGSRRIQIAG